MWASLNFCMYSEGFRQWWRKTLRKCGNSLGPQDTFYCLLAGCAGLSETGALNWSLVLLVVCFAPMGCLTIQKSIQHFNSNCWHSLSNLLLPIVHLQMCRPFCSLETLVRNFSLVHNAASNFGSNISWDQSLPALYSVLCEAEPACICYWAKCPRKDSPVP